MIDIRFRISRAAAVPLVNQIHDQVVAAITAGDLGPGDRLPPIRRLAQHLEVNRNTVAQAYRLLEQEKYLETKAGGGTSVARSTPVALDRGRVLRDLVRAAIEAAVAAGFTAQEFAELAYYEAARRSRPAVAGARRMAGGQALVASTRH